VIILPESRLRTFDSAETSELKPRPWKPTIFQFVDAVCILSCSFPAPARLYTAKKGMKIEMNVFANERDVAKCVG
jgi:hypothetical protein